MCVCVCVCVCVYMYVRSVFYGKFHVTRSYLLKNNVNIRLVKARTAIDKLLIIWKFDLSDKI